MRQDDRAPFDRALHPARLSAYASGEFVGQESFMTAGEILDLAERAGVGHGQTVLDLCCGTGGPGRFIAGELRCDYLGVDGSASAVAIARERTNGAPCRFAAAHVPPLPAGPFDVVLLLETMLIFPDKDALARAIAGALRPGGRLGFTLEEGLPLTPAERTAMPDADTVWLTPLGEMVASLERAGLAVTWQEDHTSAHRATARALADAFAANADDITAQIGQRAFDDLLAAHRLWIDWLDTGRVRKLAVVAERGLVRQRDLEPPSRSAARRALDVVGVERAHQRPDDRDPERARDHARHGVGGRRHDPAHRLARLDPASEVHEGDEADLWINTSRLHLFDPETGRSLTAPPA